MVLYQEANQVVIYTDGSCHTQSCFGAWAAIVLIDNEKIKLSGVQENTTHNRMEIQAVIQALEFIYKRCRDSFSVKVISDSQYVVNLRNRKIKLMQRNFITNGGKPIQNVDLVKKLFYFDMILKIQYEKIKAHQQKVENEINYNIEVDGIARALVRKG